MFRCCCCPCKDGGPDRSRGRGDRQTRRRVVVASPGSSLTMSETHRRQSRQEELHTARIEPRRVSKDIETLLPFLTPLSQHLIINVQNNISGRHGPTFAEPLGSTRTSAESTRTGAASTGAHDGSAAYLSVPSANIVLHMLPHPRLAP